MEIDFKTLYHNAPCGYLNTQEDGTLIEVNDTFLAFSGYSRKEIIKNKRTAYALRSFFEKGVISD